jgi:hypothetical protein
VPSPLSTSPSSPANDNSVLVRGAAESESVVSLFGNATCSGPELASGSAAAFASPGLEIEVPDDSTTVISARITDEFGNESACSTETLTYVEASTPPETELTDTPKATIKLKRGKKKAAVSFGFDSSADDATFECSIDGKTPTACTSPASFKAKAGKHTFAVASSSKGLEDSSPATFSFKVKKAKKNKKKR